ncbi:hypothetical protein GCM10010199_54660 [Dactylosporangium roseum]
MHVQMYERLPHADEPIAVSAAMSALASRFADGVRRVVDDHHEQVFAEAVAQLRA